MAVQQHLEQLQQGVVQWNKWREQHPEIRPNLWSADLHGTDLHGANLRDTNLVSANLIHANLGRAILVGANLGRATLRHANLRDAFLSLASLNDADLSHADLSHASLNRASIDGAYLSYANLSYATLAGTVLANLDLRQTKGLLDMDHRGPSPLSLFSVQLPQDGSALHFLRGVGVPDNWIALYRGEMMHHIHYHSCFISYSSKDEILARRLHADLQAHGVRCWFAPEDLKIGDKIRSRIDEAIHLQDKLLLLLSEGALASTWVEDEVEAAIEKEQKQQREVLFPIRLDEQVMQTAQAWAAKLRRTRHIGDFTCWADPQAYQHAFERLLRDLKSEV